MRLVLADTGPLYALTDPDDQYHGRSHSELARLKAARCTLTAPLPVLGESYSLILYRLGPETVIRWWDRTHAGGVGLLNPNRDDYLQAAQRIARFRDQPLSLFDGLLLILSERLDVPVWTFDHHLEVAGGKIWRPA